MDIGLLVLRIVVGALFVGHGTQKLFGWFGGGGLKGTGGFFHSIGFRPARPAAVLGGLSEAGGGLLILFGFLTPLGAAAIIGMMTGATLSVHLSKGVWNTNGGYELPLVYAASATLLAFGGPGRYSVDTALGWNPAGTEWALAAIAFGVLGGLAGNAYRLWQLRRGSRDEPSAGDTIRRAA